MKTGEPSSYGEILAHPYSGGPGLWTGVHLGGTSSEGQGRAVTRIISVPRSFVGRAEPQCVAHPSLPPTLQSSGRAYVQGAVWVVSRTRQESETAVLSASIKG